MTQNFKVSIKGVDITSMVTTTTINDVMNRFYNVAMVTVSKEVLAHEGDAVTVIYGSHTLNGFIYALGRASKSTVLLEIRTDTAKLTEPYSTSETVIENAVTSHDLCALYQQLSGVPIINLSANLDFGGSYERSGTMLSALTNIASVTGAEYYEQNNRVFIAPNKPIPLTGEIVVDDADIFDFIQTKKGVYNNGIGNIILQNGGSPKAGVIVPNKIYAEIDEETGDLFVYLTPNGVLEKAEGVSSLVPIDMERMETMQMLDDDTILLRGSIKSIKSVKLNGIEMTGYDFKPGYSAITLNREVRGSLEVVYRAYCLKGIVATQETPMGRFMSIDLVYKDQLLLFSGFLKTSGASIGTDGQMDIITEGSMVYATGFNVYTIGGSPEFEFYDKNVFLGSGGVTSTDADILINETVALGESFSYTTRHNIKTIAGVRSKDVPVNYTHTGNTITLDAYAPSVVIAYYTEGKKHHVQFADIPGGEVTMSVRNADTGSRRDYSLTNVSGAGSGGGEDCQLPLDYYVDVAREWGLSISTLYGGIVPVYYNEAHFADIAIDEFGKVKIHVVSDGVYILDASNFLPRTTTTLIVDTQGNM